MSRRIYIGHLPPMVQKGDVEDHFRGYGRILDIKLMGNFGFVEFESSRDAEDVIKDFNNRPFMGEKNLVTPEDEMSTTLVPLEVPDLLEKVFESPSLVFLARPAGRCGNFPLASLPNDLKDYGRLGGNNIIYADVDRNNPGQGIIEYPTIEDCEDAVKRLAGVDINGAPVTLEIVSYPKLERELMDRTLLEPMMPDVTMIVDLLLVITMTDDPIEAMTIDGDLVITNEETMTVEMTGEKIEVMIEGMTEETTGGMTEETIDTLPETDLLEEITMLLKGTMMIELLEQTENSEYTMK
uniref:RRM domain-containing protein n=1 Tax=Kwoniella bestiolae CBS 10118 TaxID=1296100 RepID=A0A1B9G4C5_9TREE|nr:hypothetical protein I302_03526 [Kwoniella bestiolae CBS 10118]OCF25852.1 hypothetical protein I302_03526 [Kwoniella bestiolae CBS 10118]